MYPTLTRGDLVLINSLRADEPIKMGDIVLFHAEIGSLASQGWVIHRVVGGDATTGYITQGDNSDYSDQAGGKNPPIAREWIASRAVTLAGKPIRIPLLGYVPLWAENWQKNQYTLPIIGLGLAIIIGVSELATPRKKKKKAPPLEKPLLYFFSGITLSLVLTASMLATSQNLTLIYEVSETAKGVLMGSSVGIMQVGEVAERPLVELNNRAILPIVATCTSSDPQISLSQDRLYLTLGQSTPVSFKVEARTPGKYQSKLWVGMFFPFLPASIIYWLAKRSFWLALFCVALLPGLPLMLYPFFDRNLRRQTTRALARSWRRFREGLPF